MFWDPPRDPQGPQPVPVSPQRTPKDLPRPSQGTPRDLPRSPKDLPRSPRGPPSTPQDLSEELWDLLSLPEYSQELLEELWTRPMTAKARSHTYRRPVPTQNWFNYIVLIEIHTFNKEMIIYNKGRQNSELQRQTHTESISADDKA